MSRAFADITFTPSVKAAQTLYGSRAANRGFELVEEKRDFLEQRDADFIMARDSFYQATISENGWPYVQHRGGPAGFLKVIDEKTIGYADFSGNAQYISVGNINASQRISLILMDYANRRRLKIWGTAKIVHENEQPELIAQLEMGRYRARIERAVVITVEAIEWNCPQHITPRFTELEVQSAMADLVEQNRQLSEKLQQHLNAATEKALVTQVVMPDSIGHGELELIITGIRQLTPRVRAFELRRPDGSDLPKVTAGSHLRVPVILANGKHETRAYSISSNPSRRDIYEIAVLREEQGQGGSVAVHQLYEIGMRLLCDLPRNFFEADSASSTAVLIAGGIGITPIKALAQELKAKGTTIQLHYAAKSMREMAYGDRLQRELGSNMHAYPADQGMRLNLRSIMAQAAANATFYVCGPEKLCNDLLLTAKELGIAANRVRYERFSASKASVSHKADQEIKLELRRSQKTIWVKADQTVLNAVREAGVQAFAQCETGQCGSCSVKVLAGEADHRDSVLNEAERKKMMCICVSRASTGELVLDL